MLAPGGSRVHQKLFKSARILSGEKIFGFLLGFACSGEARVRGKCGKNEARVRGNCGGNEGRVRGNCGVAGKRGCGGDCGETEGIVRGNSGEMKRGCGGNSGFVPWTWWQKQVYCY